MRFTTLKKPSDAKRVWFHVDAEGLVLGRLAVVLARYLMGKHKPEYTPHIDVGDFLVVTNVEKVVVTGRKSGQKTYVHYTHYPSGLKEVPFAVVKAKKPDMILREAVRRMLPKNKLGRARLKKLKLYAGDQHPHQAQAPSPLPESAAWVRITPSESKA